MVNEDAKPFDGDVEIDSEEDIYLYDAWEDSCTQAQCERSGGRVKVRISVDPSKSVFLMAGNKEVKQRKALPSKKLQIASFRQSVCRSIDYPNFGKEKVISKLCGYRKTDKKFSGYIRYETEIDVKKVSRAVLEITDAYEGVELFVNGATCGMQIVPKYVYDITDKLQPGKNTLRIEVATTLERERKGKSRFPTGISGEVNLYLE